MSKRKHLKVTYVMFKWGIHLIKLNESQQFENVFLFISYQSNMTIHPAILISFVCIDKSHN